MRRDFPGEATRSHAALRWAFRILALGKASPRLRRPFTLSRTWCEEAQTSHLNRSCRKGRRGGQEEEGERERLTGQIPAAGQVVSAEKSVACDARPTWMSSPAESSGTPAPVTISLFCLRHTKQDRLAEPSQPTDPER